MLWRSFRWRWQLKISWNLIKKNSGKLLSRTKLRIFVRKIMSSYLIISFFKLFNSGIHISFIFQLDWFGYIHLLIKSSCINFQWNLRALHTKPPTAIIIDQEWSLRWMSRSEWVYLYRWIYFWPISFNFNWKIWGLRALRQV